MTRVQYEDKILRVARRIEERREARAFAEAFVAAPKWMQDEIREEFNRPSPFLDILTRGLTDD